MTRECRVELVSRDVRTLLGYEPAEVVGASMFPAVHRDDQPTLLASLGASLERCTTVHVQVRILDKQRSWRPVRLTVCPFIPEAPPRFALVATRADGTSPGGVAASDTRMAALEALIRRFLIDVLAVGTSGAAASACPEGIRARLTDRELEVFHHLLAGHRVPAIADTLYLSQSTIRNHLCSIYRKLGVHSQVELLELALRPQHLAQPPG